MKLIDANVFIYAAGREHPYRSPSKRVLSLVLDGSLEANTDTEILQEILHYYRTRRDTPFGRVVLRGVIDAFPTPFEVTVRMAQTAADVLEGHPQLQARDAVHAAVVLENDLEGIITADRSFEGIPGVKRFDPKEF